MSTYILISIAINYPNNDHTFALNEEEMAFIMEFKEELQIKGEHLEVKELDRILYSLTGKLKPENVVNKLAKKKFEDKISKLQVREMLELEKKMTPGDKKHIEEMNAASQRRKEEKKRVAEEQEVVKKKAEEDKNKPNDEKKLTTKFVKFIGQGMEALTVLMDKSNEPKQQSYESSATSPRSTTSQNSLPSITAEKPKNIQQPKVKVQVDPEISSGAENKARILGIVSKNKITELSNNNGLVNNFFQFIDKDQTDKAKNLIQSNPYLLNLVKENIEGKINDFITQILASRKLSKMEIIKISRVCDVNVIISEKYNSSTNPAEKAALNDLYITLNPEIDKTKDTALIDRINALKNVAEVEKAGDTGFRELCVAAVKTEAFKQASEAGINLSSHISLAAQEKLKEFIEQKMPNNSEKKAAIKNDQLVEFLYCVIIAIYQLLTRNNLTSDKQSKELIAVKDLLEEVKQKAKSSKEPERISLDVSHQSRISRKPDTSEIKH